MSMRTNRPGLRRALIGWVLAGCAWLLMLSLGAALPVAAHTPGSGLDPDALPAVVVSDEIVRGEILGRLVDGTDPRVPGHLDLVDVTVYATNADGVIVEWTTEGPILEPRAGATYSYRLYFDTDEPYWTRYDRADRDFYWSVEVRSGGERSASDGVVLASDAANRVAMFADIRHLSGIKASVAAGAWPFGEDGMQGEHVSDPVRIQLPHVTPATPEGLRVSAKGDDFIEWSWSSVAGVDGYEVQFSLDEAFAAEDEIIIRTSAETSYRRSSLPPGTIGFLRVRSIGGTEEARLWSEWSLSAVAMTVGNDGMTVLGNVTVLPAGDIVHRPAHFFDLEGKTVTFTPAGEGRYAVRTGPLNWVETSAATGPVHDLGTGSWRGKSAELSLSFGFPFAGRTWTRVHVNTNGNLSFAAPETTHAEQRDIWADGRIRSVAAAVDSRSAVGLEAMIAALWAIYGEAVVSVAASSARVAITWEAVRTIPRNHYYEPAGRNVFQIRLYPSGKVELAYREVPERDGIVGLFHGTRAHGDVLSAATDDIGDVRTATVDIVSAKLIDNGSTVIASATMAADIPERVSSGSLAYRFNLYFGAEICGVNLIVGTTGRTPNGCGFVPAAVGYRVRGATLEIPISKTLWPDDQAVSWRVTAEWSGPDESESDRISGEPVHLDESSDGDLSSRSATVAGNLFEVFHYPSIRRDGILSSIYGQAPAEDELVAVFSDFRFDDIFNTGPGSGPINVSIQGIGDKQTRAQSGSKYGSDSLLSAVIGVRYIGGPRWAESSVEEAYAFHGHSYGVRHVAHELVHRWSSNLEFRDPQSRRTETLTDGRSSHWSNWLHAPARYPVWSGFANEPYSTASVMGGGIWRDNGDGTFTEQDKGYPRAMGLSDLDLYAMGMIPPEEVRPTFLLRDAVETGTRGVYRATKVPVRIEDIVAALGPRVPTAGEQRKVFRLGVYLLHEDGRPPRPEWVARAHNIAEDVASYFSLATGGAVDPVRMGDTDGDGVRDNADAFPNDPDEQFDTDGDGIGDDADGDDDGDGVPDGEDERPLDTDNDGVDNRADTDDDNDGVPDTEDPRPFDPAGSGGTAGNVGMTVLGKVTALPAGDLVVRPARFFDLEGKTVTFTPDGEDRYAVHTDALTWVETGAATDPVFDLSGGGSEGKSTELSLPFDFPFAGRTWKGVHANTNGNISFAAPETTHGEQRDLWSDARMRSVAAAVDSRSATGLEAMIAVLWALYDEAVVYVTASPERVAITWDAVTSDDYEPAGRNAFQVRLYPSGVIEFAYQQVPERDGIVGLFHGTDARGRVLNAATDDVGNVRNATVDIVSAELVDNGSTVIASATMAADIPEQASSGSLEYRFYLNFGTGTCRLKLSVGVTGRASDGCGVAPSAVGYTVRGPTLEIPISKTLWPEKQAVSWHMRARWWGPDEEEDNIYGEPVTLDESSDRDLSSGPETVAGNVFEVFHYPSIPTRPHEVLPYIYERAPPDDELVMLFADFRYDGVYNNGPATGPVNVPIQGIGDMPADPRRGSTFGSDSLLSAVTMRYIGGPTYAESGVYFGYEYHGHADRVHNAAHELVHRWSAYMRFRNPLSGRIEGLTNDDDPCRCHWSQWLHVPERYPVSGGFSKQPYSARSVMSGNVWQDNGDGTFTQQPRHYPVRGLSDLDLYVMGMIPPEEVRPTFLLRDVVETETRGVVRATRVPVRIEDIVAALGPRVPSASEQRKVFRLGVYLLHEDGREPHPEWVARAESFTADVARYFAIATGGAGDPEGAGDSDGDGIGDDVDAFADDASEWADTDGDGVGDNTDVFPQDPYETIDTDGDRVGDNADAFPADASEWSDTDGDGVGDNADPDADGDGVADEFDVFPLDASRSDIASYTFIAETVDDELGDVLLGTGGEDSRVILSAPRHDSRRGAVYVIAVADLDALDAADGRADREVHLAHVSAGTDSWRLVGESGGDRAGVGVATADIDGDGAADLVIGASGADGSTRNTGAVYLVSGGDLAAADAADGAADRTVSLAHVAAQPASWKILGDECDGLGGSVAAGDLYGDTSPELVIGAPEACWWYDDRRAGSAYLLSVDGLEASDAADGAADGVVQVANLTARTGFWRLAGEGSAHSTGDAVGLVGDVDGDGYSDVGVGAPWAEFDDDRRGAAYIVSTGALSAADAADGASDGVVELARVAGQLGSWKATASTRSALGQSISHAGSGKVLLGGWDSHVVATADLAGIDAADGAVNGLIEAERIADAPDSWTLDTGPTMAGDVDGDGGDEMLSGYWGEASLFDPATLAELDAADGEEDGIVKGWAIDWDERTWRMRRPGPGVFQGLAGAGDVDGDGLGDLLLAERPDSDRDRPNRVYFLSGADLVTLDESDGAPDRYLRLGNVAGDTDGDGLGNTLDPDDDNDGFPDVNDDFQLDAAEWVDTDGDGVGDNADAFPNDRDEQLDTDGDGIGDDADGDDDGDGVPDGEDEHPLDTDNDGLDNRLDPDDDNDGVNDDEDALPYDPTESVDTDADGIGNNADEDDDNDGVPDAEDAFPLDSTESADSDGDGVGDNADAFPDDPEEQSDADGDGIGNNADPDDDNDGIPDTEDPDPFDPTGSRDKDADGVANAVDLFPSDLARWSLTSLKFMPEAGVDGLGAGLAALGDLDGDGRPELLMGAPGLETGGAAYLVSSRDLQSADDADGARDGVVAVEHVAAQLHSWKLQGEEGLSAGGAMNSAGDLNGDDVPEFTVVGATALTGAAYVMSGPDLLTADADDGVADGVIALTAVAGGAASWRLDGAWSLGTGNGIAGARLAEVGAGQVLIGQPVARAGGGPGTAHLLAGGHLAVLDSTTDGVVDGRLDLYDHAGPWRFTGENGLDAAGSAVAMADFDGDGRPDAVIGAPGHDAFAPDDGAVYLVGSRDFGAGDSFELADAAAGEFSFKIVGEAAGHRLGSSVATGDVNGDGHADLVLGAASCAGPGAIVDVVSGARADLLRLDGADGAGDGLIRLAGGGLTGHWRVACPEGSWWLGDVATVDAYGDGRVDLLVSLIGSIGNATVVLLPASVVALDAGDRGTATIESAADAGYAFDAGAHDVRRLAVATAGDMDGDGREDILLGVVSNESSAAYLIVAADLEVLDASDGMRDGVIDIANIAGPRL